MKPKVHPSTISRLMRRQAGQTVIEVLLATAVVGVVMTAIAIGLTLSVRNTSEARLRAYASVQGQQVMEVFRRERVINGWGTFRSNLTTGDYCFNTLPSSLADFANHTGECTEGISSQGTEFRTNAEVIVGPDSVAVTIRVSWIDGSRTPSVTLVQEFRPYADE